MSAPIRLSKRLIELTGCSRREAELYIEGGWVLVDGKVIDQPQFKVDTQRVELHAEAQAKRPDPISLLLNQPADVSPQQAQALLTPAQLNAELSAHRSCLRGHLLRLESALPLQQGASGLQIFTQDWRTLRHLNDHASKIEQEYVVQVSGEAIAHALQRLNQGHSYKGHVLPPVKASWQNETHLRLVLKNPGADLVTQLCDSVGLQLEALRRIRVGGVSMGKLPLGQWRYLLAKEKF